MEFSAIPVRTQALAALFVLALVVLLNRVYKARSSKLGHWMRVHPIVGSGKQWLSWWFGTLRSINQSRNWAYSGYSKYSKSNSPFLVPCLDRGPTVIIPPRQLKKIYNLPTSVLDVYETQHETIQSKYTISDHDVWRNSYQIDVIRHQMTRNLKTLTPPIATELALGFERQWGSDIENWKEFRIWDSSLKLIAGASNGAFCGAPLCRNLEFLDSMRDHAMGVFVGAMAIGATPSFVRPVSGKLVSWFCEYRFRKVLKLCLLFVKERLENTARAKSDAAFCWTPPQDGLQWIIEKAHDTKSSVELDPVRVARRLLYVNDISLHSTSYTVQNMILDLYSCEQSESLVADLRDECASALKEAGGSWTRAAVEKLKLVDATIRESMRLTPFASIGLPRTVMDPHGISLESPTGKINVPQGTVIAVPMDPIHKDETIYPEARRFNPLRFTQPDANRDIFDHFNPGNDGDAPAPRKASSTATLDNAFLGFGFGKFACPGRFFALNELKLFVAHMVLNYDVECLDRRPELTDVIWLKVPYNDGRVRVRKRAAAWKPRN